MGSIHKELRRLYIERKTIEKEIHKQTYRLRKILGKKEYDLLSRNLAAYKRNSEKRLERDQLTGLMNIMGLKLRFGEMILQTDRENFEKTKNKTALSIVVFDIDYFKKLNDKYGHNVGDKILQCFARILSNSKAGDVAGRWHGEEFILLLPNTRSSVAKKVVERKAKEFYIATSSMEGIEPVTFSAGITSYPKLIKPGNVIDVIILNLLESADKAMYKAKEEGRNRAVIYDPAWDK